MLSSQMIDVLRLERDLYIALFVRKLTQREIATVYYSYALRLPEDWIVNYAGMNAAIIARWGSIGLKRVKGMAWRNLTGKPRRQHGWTR